jgi:drug/metabolite transporter (DMT)-like permease
VILACAGVIYLIDPTNASFSSATTQGDVLIILNCFSYATYIAVSKRLINHYGALKSIAVDFSFRQYHQRAVRVSFRFQPLI